jgi:CheY-like chemotaxis protein
MSGWSIAGGRLVPKILVADDNSNIQKMVGLALKDQGIDVVAVGNGEAAVRKIADVRPDLVLADVFMPVRNGYEVCQFVKMDPGLAHIPVILLVGAFDPLDEQEAQRVGADGVLKKPFVPADPLISMVKSALQRAGVPHANAGSTKAPEPEGLRVADLLTPGGASVPTLGAVPGQPAHETPMPANAPESFVEEVAHRPEPVRMDSGAHPVAFGSLLETPVQETEEEDQSLVSAPPPEFAMERDWRDADEEEMEEEEDEEPAAWRPEGSEVEVPAAKDKSKKSKSSATDWRTGGFEQIAAGKSRGMGWEPEEETPKPVETAPVASQRVTETTKTAPITSPRTTETTKTPPTALPETPAVPATPFGADAWALPASTTPQGKVSVETTTAVEEVSRTTKEPAVSKGKESTAAEVAKKEPGKKEAKDSWFSVSPNPWDAEIQKASQLASTWDAPTAVSAPGESSAKQEKAVESVAEETKAEIEEAALPSAAVEAIREEAAQVAVDAKHKTDHGISGESPFYPREETSKAPAPEPTANMDDLVAKVLAKMNPDVLQAVTREILKPVVEAMVKEELKSKKS